MHQQLMTEAEKITGYASEPETPKIDPDPATGAIKIKYNDDPKTKYTWKSFTLDQGQDHRLDWQDRTREVRAVVAHHPRSIPWARGKAEVRVPVKRQKRCPPSWSCPPAQPPAGATPSSFLKGDRAGPGDLRQMTTTTPVRGVVKLRWGRYCAVRW
jgi:hypothetical protein